MQVNRKTALRRGLISSPGAFLYVCANRRKWESGRIKFMEMYGNVWKYMIGMIVPYAEGTSP